MRLIRSHLLLFSFVLLAGCSSTDVRDPASIYDLPREIVEWAAPSGSVLFQDDFSDPSSGWTVSQDPDGIREYTEGEFRFTIQRPDWYYWSTPGFVFSDVQVDVRVSLLAADGITSLGLICRYEDEGNFYAFTITSDGYFGVSKVVDGVEALIGQTTLTSSPDIFQGRSSNFLSAACIDDQLTLWINGTEALTVQDESFSQGEVGLIGSVLEGQHAVMEFDNVSIRKP